MWGAVAGIGKGLKRGAGHAELGGLDGLAELFLSNQAEAQAVEFLEHELIELAEFADDHMDHGLLCGGLGQTLGREATLLAFHLDEPLVRQLKQGLVELEAVDAEPMAERHEGHPLRLE